MKVDPSALEAAHLIDRLDRLIRSGASVDGLNPAQWEALRYLARANRFSRTPAALADYLGSTRGTVSQTLIALEQKGFVGRTQSTRDKRSIDLELTSQAEAALRGDPLIALARDLAASAGAEIDGIVTTLRAALHRAVARNDGKAFGACHTCRHFQRDVGTASRTPHRCGLLDEPLSETDSRAICVEQELAEA
jgi:DNA-binding MarR family transcriptional regulator